MTSLLVTTEAEFPIIIFDRISVELCSKEMDLGAIEMVQWVGALTALVENPAPTKGCSQQSTTLVPGALIPSELRQN